MGEFVHVPQALYTYRKHSGSMTDRESDRLQGWLELVREWGEDLLKSVGFNRDLETVLQRLEEENRR